MESTQGNVTIGRVLADAMRFMDIAAGEGLSMKHDAGYYLDAADICVAFTEAIGLEFSHEGFREALSRLEAFDPAAGAENQAKAAEIRKDAEGRRKMLRAGLRGPTARYKP